MLQVRDNKVSRWDGMDEVVAIADTGSFVAAARRLGESTSMISRAVARLEERLGLRLFERTTRSVALTDAGRSIVEQFRRIIEERDEALRLVHAQGEMRGEVRLTSSVAIGERFVAPVVEEFLRAHPGLSVHLETTNRVIDLVSEGFDIAIRTGNQLDARLAARQVAERSLLVCAAPAYIARAGAPAHPAELVAHECLLGTSTNWHFREDGQRSSIVPTGRLRCNSGNAVMHAAENGMGLCQLPAFYVREAIAAGRLVRLLEDYEDLPEPVWAVYPQRRFTVPKVRALIDLLERRLPALIA